MWSRLPLDILAFIFSLLSKRKYLEAVSLVCKDWNKVASHSSLKHIWNQPENWQRVDLYYWVSDLEEKKLLKNEEYKLLKKWEKEKLKDLRKVILHFELTISVENTCV